MNEVQRLAGLQSGKILSFVLARLESAYYDKIVGTGSQYSPFKEIAQNIKNKCKHIESHFVKEAYLNELIQLSRSRKGRLANVIFSQKPTPEEYIRFVITQNMDHKNAFKVNEHWRPQYINCPFCLFTYKVYGHSETMEEDTAYILLNSNLTNLLFHDVNSDRSHSSRPTKKIERREEFCRAVDIKYLEPLHSIFALVFQMFQY